MALLGLCIVLWVVGGMVARRSAPRAKETKAAPGTSPTAALPAKGKAGRAPARKPAEVDPEMAEIEALLKSRGIE